jgi:hypothetical protein
LTVKQHLCLVIATVACATYAAGSPATALATTEQATIVAPADGSLSSSPQENPPHHAPFGGDWAMDIAGAVGRPVYARFSNESGALALNVVQQFEPCAPPNGGTAGVGVRVQVTVDGVSLGVVNYLHLANAHAPGPIANGEQIGTMAAGTPTSCWSGAHVHVEPRNDSKYSCFQPTPLNSAITASSKLGVIGGEYASGTNQACPAGAVDTPAQPPPPPPPPPPDTTAPTLSVHVAKHQRLRRIRRHGVRIRVTCSEDCNVGVFLSIRRKTARRLGFRHRGRPVVVGGGALPVAANQKGLIHAKLTHAAKRRLRRGVHVKVAVVAEDAAKNRTVKRRRFRLRR